MNQKTTYEITIAEKLQQVAIPDMREAIWSRIEDQLDIDMPEGDGPGGPDTTDLWNLRRITRNFGALAVIVAVITTIFLTNKKSSTTPNSKLDIPPTNSPRSLKPNEHTNDPPERSKTDNASVSNPVDTGTFLFVNDSVFNNPVVEIPRPLLDTIIPKQIPPQIITTSVPPKDTARKKPKGFKGITEDDYRINLKKDSVP